MDTVESHRAFVKDNALPFRLLADPSGEVAARYGVDTSGGYARRVTFVIGPDGVIRHVFPDVEIDGHAEAVVAAVRATRR
jgi:peroxiredoxin Q/BCP